MTNQHFKALKKAISELNGVRQVEAHIINGEEIVLVVALESGDIQGLTIEVKA